VSVPMSKKLLQCVDVVSRLLNRVFVRSVSYECGQCT
jgi:hypothetical protein